MENYKKNIGKKTQIGARGPTSPRIPKLLSSTQSRRKKKQQSTLKKREETSREAQGCPREQMNGYGMHNVLWSQLHIKPAEYLRTPDGARANAVELIWKCDWPEAKGISLATFHARLNPTRLIWDDWTRMAHKHIDRQAKGILSKRDFTKKPRSGQEDPPLREFPNDSVAPNQEEKEAAEPP